VNSGKYGRDKVGADINLGALLSRRPVCATSAGVARCPNGQVDRLSKIFSGRSVEARSIEKALADEHALREEANGTKESSPPLLNYWPAGSRGLVAQTHRPRWRGVVDRGDPAAGAPLGAAVSGSAAPTCPPTQFNMKWVEQAGLVKFDFLGLKTLTVIQNAVDQIKVFGPSFAFVAADGNRSCCAARKA